MLALFFANCSPQHTTLEYITFDIVLLSHIPLEDNAYTVALGKEM